MDIFWQSNIWWYLSIPNSQIWITAIIVIFQRSTKELDNRAHIIATALCDISKPQIKPLMTDTEITKTESRVTQI